MPPTALSEIQKLFTTPEAKAKIAAINSEVEAILEEIPTLRVVNKRRPTPQEKVGWEKILKARRDIRAIETACFKAQFGVED
jgi:hypothetical protein